MALDGAQLDGDAAERLSPRIEDLRADRGRARQLQSLAMRRGGGRAAFEGGAARVAGRDVVGRRDPEGHAIFERGLAEADPPEDRDEDGPSDQTDDDSSHPLPTRTSAAAP